MKTIINQPLCVYDTPRVQLVEICPEQCLASSCSLEDMKSNDVYNEEF